MVELLDAHNDAVRRELARFAGEEIDTSGDGFLAFFDGPARAIRCARSIRDSLRQHGLEVRAGVHTGEVELRPGEKPSGIALHLGARVMSLAGAGEVLVSSTTHDLVAGSGLEFEDRGEHELKGIAGARRVFAALCGELLSARVVTAIRSARLTSWIARRIAAARSSSCLDRRSFGPELGCGHEQLLDSLRCLSEPVPLARRVHREAERPDRRRAGASRASERPSRCTGGCARR